MLELRDLTKIYNAGTVTEMTLFDHFNLTVDDGQFVSIVGSNGSGKTSLLNILCGSIPLDGGDVLVGGKSIRKQKDFQRYATIGRVYQNPSLGTCPNLTMLENMSLADNKGKRFGLGFGVNRKRIDFYRAELASLGLGLEDKLDVKMGALSGGQRQAVALLMATMTPLNFLILDEHTAALDPKTAGEKGAFCPGKRKIPARPGACGEMYALESSLGLFHQGGEGGLVGDGDLGEHLAVELDAGLLQAVHEAAVVDAVHLAGGADAGDPQTAEIALLQLAAHIGIPQGLHHLLVGDLEVVLFVAPIALRQLNDLFSSLARHHRAFYSSHDLSSF